MNKSLADTLTFKSSVTRAFWADTCFDKHMTTFAFNKGGKSSVFGSKAPV